jgi:hypothetical protein
LPPPPIGARRHRRLDGKFGWQNTCGLPSSTRVANALAHHKQALGASSIGPVLTAVPFLGRLHRETWRAVAESAPPPANGAEMQKHPAAALDQPAPSRARLVVGGLVLGLWKFGGSRELRRSDHGRLRKNADSPWHPC